MRQPRMTQLLATLVPAMFEAWNKVRCLYSSLLPPLHFDLLFASRTLRAQAEISYVHRKVLHKPRSPIYPAHRDGVYQATCGALLSMTSSEKISRMEAEVRTACDVVQKASTELECMRAREALKRRCAILNTRIESLQV